MTALELYNSSLIELNKLNAPVFTVEQFNYFVNKAIQAFVDERYNFYAVNQQLTDDLRVLLKTYTAPNDDLSATGKTVSGILEDTVQGIVYGVETQDLIDGEIVVGTQIFFEDDVRLRTVTSVDTTANTFEFSPTMYVGVSSGGGGDTQSAEGIVAGSRDYIKIGDEISKSNQVFVASTTLSNYNVLKYDIAIDNYYHMLAVRTYWEGSHTTSNGKLCSTASSVRKMYPAKRLTYDMLTNIENNSYLRPMYRQPYYLLQDNLLNLGTEKNAPGSSTYYMNKPRIEIHMGNSVTGIDLISVETDYLKLPETVVLTEDEVYVNSTDLSQILEWPDYLNSELIKRLVSYFLENHSNPRVQTFPMLQEDTPRIPLELQGG